MLLETWLLPSPDRPLPRFFLFFLFASVIFVGLLLNFLVAFRMLRLFRTDRHQFMSGTGVFLTVMALSDSLAMLSSFSQLLSSLLSPPALFHLFLCSSSEWTWRVSFCLSMYSWLAMSSLRYVAALRPLQYSLLGRGPLLALSSVAAIAFILNLHLFVSVSATDVCIINVDTMTAVYGFMDVFLSFVVPFLAILAMDMRVLFCRSDRRHSSQPLIIFKKVDDDSDKKKASAMRRFMFITLLHLVLCCPEHLVRALRLSHVFVQPTVVHAARCLSYVKFSFNAFYLTSFVFDRNVVSKQSSSRALSVSLRRLDDQPSIVPRGRSNTVSYRAPTPVPIVLTRNSSCMCLDNTAPSSPKSPVKWT